MTSFYTLICILGTLKGGTLTKRYTFQQTGFDHIAQKLGTDSPEIFCAYIRPEKVITGILIKVRQ